MGICSETDEGSFTYSLSVEKDTYVIGEPIAVSFVLTNCSSISRKIEKWRGPLAGVMKGRDDFDFAVYYLSNGKKVRLDYHGEFVDGEATYIVLGPGESWKQTYTINSFSWPAYELQNAGEYLVCSTYFSYGDEKNRDSFSGRIRAGDIRIKLARLEGNGLRKLYPGLTKGRDSSIAIVAAHHDANSIPALAELCSNQDLKTRQLTYKALGIIGTDEALDTLGKAVLKESEYNGRLQIVGIFKTAGNAIAVPYLRQLLNDPYASVIGMNGKHYKQYLVRRDASRVLNEFGTEDRTEYLEEIQEPIAAMPEDDREKLFAEALSDNQSVQFEAVRRLAVLGYSPSSAAVLTRIACDANAAETTRNYAAMGLGNFTNGISSADKAFIQEKLKNIVAGEALGTPDGIIRLLIKWGAASFLYETFAEKLRGHPLEIDVLEHIEGRYATDRLLDIYGNCPKARKASHYGLLDRVGRALTNRGDIRGIDILMTLLDKESSPSDQHRNNIYCFLAIKLDNDFGYEAGNYRPELEQAIPQMISWWEKNRENFRLRK